MCTKSFCCGKFIDPDHRANSCELILSISLIDQRLELIFKFFSIDYTKSPRNEADLDVVNYVDHNVSKLKRLTVRKSCSLLILAMNVIYIRKFGPQRTAGKFLQFTLKRNGLRITKANKLVLWHQIEKLNHFVMLRSREFLKVPKDFNRCRTP